MLFYSKSQAQGAAKPAAGAASGAPKPALSVQTVRPLQSTLALQLAANGSLAAWQEAVVGAEINGLRLADVRVGVGDRVRRGQVLAVFDAATVQAELAQVRAAIAEAQAATAEAQASAAEAAANAERARSLKDTGALSAQQILQFVTAEQATQGRVQVAQARVQSAQAQLVSQNLRIKHTQVLAPDDGVISARQATVGAVAGAGQELFRLIRKNRLEWRGEVTSGEITRLAKDAKVRLTAASGAQVEGRVRMLAPTVDAQTRNGLVYVDVPEHPGLKAGMFARGEFELGGTSAVTLPASALVLRDGFTYAFRVDAGNKVSQVKLQTGRRSGDRVEVVNGIKTDQNFVASGAAFLADGDTVRIVPGAAAAPVAIGAAPPVAAVSAAAMSSAAAASAAK